MVDTREIQCNGKQFLVKRFPDDVIGVFDPAGKMIVGWPETTVLVKAAALEMSDEEFCKILARLRRL